MSTKQITKRKITVLGASNKLGVTHICLCLANFLHSALKQKVLYIELGRESSLLSLVGDTQISLNGITGYKHKGVTYILSCDVNTAINLLNCQTGFIIVDISSLNEDTIQVFNQCENKIVIGSMKAWCKRDLIILLQYLKGVTDMKTLNFYNLSWIENEMNEFRKEYRSTIYHLPRIDDPFSISEADFDSLYQMLK